jgi:hypothetical protein
MSAVPGRPARAAKKLITAKDPCRTHNKKVTHITGARVDLDHILGLARERIEPIGGKVTLCPGQN